MSWDALGSKDLQVRQSIAAYYASDYPHVIEVGGWKNNMSSHLNLERHESVTIVDPNLENKKEGNLIVVKGVINDIEINSLNSNCCLVALGYGLDYIVPKVGRKVRRWRMKRDMGHFIKLAQKAGLVIIEHAAGHGDRGLAETTLNTLKETLKIQAEIKLNFNNKFYSGQRNMFILRRKNQLPRLQNYLLTKEYEDLPLPVPLNKH